MCDEQDFHPTFTADECLDWFDEVLKLEISDTIPEGEENNEAFSTLFGFMECKAGLILWNHNPDYEFDGYYDEHTVFDKSKLIEVEEADLLFVTPITTTGDKDEPVKMTEFTTWGLIPKETYEMYKDSDNFRNTIKDLFADKVRGAINIDVNTIN